MDKIMVSVIIPAYNAENTISKTILSIVDQSANENIKEIIVINDGCTDNTSSIVEKLSKTISVIPIKLICQPNQGVSISRNKGVKESSAEWIAFCDSDDLWFKDKLRLQINCIKKHNIKFLGSSLKNYKPKVGSLYKDNLYSINIKQLLIKTWPQTSTVLMEKNLFIKTHGFPNKQKYSEDGNLWIKCLQYENIYYLNEELVDYGSGKSMFGASGLSANTKEMHKGVLKNIKDAYHYGLINKINFYFFSFYEILKYLRRRFILKIKR